MHQQSAEKTVAMAMASFYDESTEAGMRAAFVKKSALFS